MGSAFQNFINNIYEPDESSDNTVSEEHNVDIGYELYLSFPLAVCIFIDTQFLFLPYRDCQHKTKYHKELLKKIYNNRI